MRRLLSLLLLCPLVLAADPAEPPAPSPEAVKKWSAVPIVVVAKLDKATYLRAGLSSPPVHMSSVEFTVKDSLRGGIKKGEKIKGFHQVKQDAKPEFPEGKDCLIALSKTRGDWVATAIEEAKPAELAQAKLALALPVGWTVEGKRLKSPWAGLPRPESKIPSPAGTVVCGFSGRPALMVGAAEFSVEKVKPAVEKEFFNPDGDGEYQITVKNKTGKEIEVPALLVDEKGNILWKECLAFVCQGKSYALPGAKGIKGKTKPLTLKPDQAETTVVQALAVKGPEWPMGGYRIEFTFALGEKSDTKSFYYHSKHHDPIREKASK